MGALCGTLPSHRKRRPQGSTLRLDSNQNCGLQSFSLALSQAPLAVLVPMAYHLIEFVAQIIASQVSKGFSRRFKRDTTMAALPQQPDASGARVQVTNGP